MRCEHLHPNSYITANFYSLYLKIISILDMGMLASDLLGVHEVNLAFT